MKTIHLLITSLCLLALCSAAAGQSAGLSGQEHKIQPARDNLSFVGTNDGTNNFHYMDVEIAGDRAYALVGVYGGLETYDISDPRNPVRLSVNGPAAWGAKALGDRLYVFCRNSGFRIYSITESTPVLLGYHDPTAGDILYENGILDGPTFYVAAHQKGLHYFDVANPADPVFLGGIQLAENSCWDVERIGSHLFVANGRFGLSVIDVSGSPTEVAALPLPGLANHIVLDGNVAVLSLGDAGIATVDISSPSSPVLLDRAHTEGNAFGSGIWNHLVAVGSWKSLEVFDVSDPARIARVAWDNTRLWPMGADIKGWGNGALVATADWNDFTLYQTEPSGEPDIDLVPDAIDFGEVAQSEKAFVVVRNTGEAVLDVTVANIPSALEIHPQTFSLLPGASRRVRMTAIGPGSLSAKIEYQSNDPDEPTYNQRVYMNSTSFPQIGSAAPDFVLQDIDGYWHYLSDYRGSVVFLEFGGLW